MGQFPVILSIIVCRAHYAPNTGKCDFFFSSCYFTLLVNGWKTYSSAGTIIISFCRWLIAVHFRWMLITSKQSKTLHNNPALCRLVLLGTRCSYRGSIAMPHHSRKFTHPFIFSFLIAKWALVLWLGKEPGLPSEAFLIRLGAFYLAICWQIPAVSFADRRHSC